MPGTGKVIAAVIAGALFAFVLTTTFFAFRKNQSEPRGPERRVVQQTNPDEYLSDFKTGYRTGFEAGILGLSRPETVGQRDGYIEGVNQGYNDGSNRLALMKTIASRGNVEASVRRGAVRQGQSDPETGVSSRFVGALSGASIGAGLGTAIGGGKGAAVGAAVGSIIGALPKGGRVRGEEVLRNAGIGAGVGGTIGGAIGGGRGAAAGSAIGAGAAVLGTMARQKSRR